MSIKKFFKKYIDAQTGLSYDYQNLANDYYKQAMGADTDFDSTASTGTLSNAALQNAYYQQKQTTTGPIMTNSTTTSTGAWPEQWTEKQKEALAKMEMTYDELKKEWVIRLSIDIRLPQEVEVMAYISGTSSKAPMDQLLDKLKYAKKQLVEKLTAKIILAELIKPREIKE